MKDKKMGESRTTMTINVTRRAKEVMDRRLSEGPLPKQKQVERIFEFLAAAPDSFHLMLTGPMPADMRDAIIDKAIAYLESLKADIRDRNHIGEIGGQDANPKSRRRPGLSALA